MYFVAGIKARGDNPETGRGIKGKKEVCVQGRTGGHCTQNLQKGRRKVHQPNSSVRCLDVS